MLIKRVEKADMALMILLLVNTHEVTRANPGKAITSVG